MKETEFQKAARIMVDCGMSGIPAPDWDAMATSFDLGGGYTIESRGQRDGSRKWVLMRWSFVYSKSERDFEYEPLPSSRTDEFMEDTRFDTKMEAWVAFTNIDKE